ncbi:MAG: FAD-dependent oxidoreductase [Paracoccus sp. (in: a-proteobacteria)]|uniref:FAD/NAD(P)-binding protein n=1 Tax=Paracoccus sp. TaxID=267 RepID=UPI0039E4B71F
MTTVEPPLRAVIIGGGFTGAAVAWHLARMRLPARITVVEPRADLGRGQAYSATDPAHRLNVSADNNMSIDPGNPLDFAEWLAQAQAAGRVAPDPAAATEYGIFPARALFGRYMAERLQPDLDSGAIRHIRARVGDIERGPEGTLMLHLSDDSRIRADLLVLATGHPAPAPPGFLVGLADVVDTSDSEGLAQVPQDGRVLILGAALSSADAVATLARQGFKGRITCLSRHGLRSRGQGHVRELSEADFTDPPLQGVSDLVRRVRHAVVDDQARGESWHAVLRRLRMQGPAIWAALDQPSRARLLRHLRSFWDVHRYRLPPQTEAVIQGLIAEDRLHYQAGHVVSVHREADELRVAWRPRGNGQVRQQGFDRLIVTTGPAQGRCIQGNPALGALARLGLITADPLGLGLATRESCKAVDAQGQASDRILVAGPLARGHVGELVGAPECAVHARGIAQQIARRAAPSAMPLPTPQPPAPGRSALSS